MMGYFWCLLLAFSVGAAIFSGSIGSLTSAAMQGAGEGITLCISLAGALCLWSGIAKLMERSGLTERLGKLLQPVFRHLFPISSADPLTLGYLTANVSANFFGLGNAATPMGIAAVQKMQEQAPKGVASDEMCLLIVINTASIQLLPTTVAAIRASLGAAAPFDILPAVWVSSVCSVCAGIGAAKLLRHA
ncbi:MAG: spore maturation protein A [Ruminococcaceae bacterium]|nr:spore maturation protein A [Oscillospiraceae bacterium]